MNHPSKTIVMWVGVIGVTAFAVAAAVPLLLMIKIAVSWGVDQPASMGDILFAIATTLFAVSALFVLAVVAIAAITTALNGGHHNE